MTLDLPPNAEPFLTDWGLTFAIGGAICALIGGVAGWIIWKNTRKFTETVEDGNRDAFAEYERTSDEMSKIKAELSNTTD